MRPHQELATDWQVLSSCRWRRYCLIVCAKEADELVEIKRAAVSTALVRLAGALAAGGVALDPVRVLGLVEDLSERAQRFVDRLVAECAKPLTGPSVDQRRSGVAGGADLTHARPQSIQFTAISSVGGTGLEPVTSCL